MFVKKNNHLRLSVIGLFLGMGTSLVLGCEERGTDGATQGQGTETDVIDTDARGTGTALDTQTESDTEDGEEGGTDTEIQETTQLTTPLGDLVGVKEGDVFAFKGIPYAESPTGQNRWKAPVPVTGWTSPLDATKERSYCIQKDLVSGIVIGEEDCLSLNIWTPDTSPQTALPVMVWLHGGAFIYGSGADPMYNGQSLAAASQVVVVTLNYRIGALGFLAHPDLGKENASGDGSGNWGLKDQRLALKWVQQNISAFGGDPNRVTLFGQSAGSISVGLHLVSEGSWDLFDAAILQSGPPDLFPQRTLSAAEKRGVEFAARFECDTIACLRETPAEELVMTYETEEQFPGGIFFQSAETDYRWTPTIDGDFLTDTAEQLVASGAVASVPVMLGTTLNEGPMFLSWLMSAVPVQNDEDYHGALDRAFGPNAGAVLSEYPVNKFPSASAALAEVNGDRFFVCPARAMARHLSQNGLETYLYSFEYLPEGMLVEEMGVHHAAEIAFVFNRDNNITSIGEEGRELARVLGNGWKSFAYEGSPLLDQAQVDWPLYDDDDTLLVFDQPLSSRSGHRAQKCNFWDSL